MRKIKEVVVEHIDKNINTWKLIDEWRQEINSIVPGQMRFTTRELAHYFHKLDEFKISRQACPPSYSFLRLQ